MQQLLPHPRGVPLIPTAEPVIHTSLLLALNGPIEASNRLSSFCLAAGACGLELIEPVPLHDAGCGELFGLLCVHDASRQPQIG